MSSLSDQIRDEMKQALKSKQKQRLDAIRLIIAAIKQKEIDDQTTLSDDQVVVLLDKMAKQRRESIEQYTTAKRDDLVAKEQFELDIISSYLPTQLSQEEINTIVRQAISDCGATSMKEMGKVMASVKPQIMGRADMTQVSALVKDLLTNG